ncbi:Icc protein [Sinobacterium caligoides]|uniref:Icc protein n=1 Tax=Sinobacterium caligoides TaxID=933926 RepID=A0A3N2DG88_9GAMM|nr:3',5'-cyclic-AMP phosphodiesterase [Sinobacterium caligoides]ROR98810.1 Icc protein [Sinobacterium caligoides]
MRIPITNPNYVDLVQLTDCHLEDNETGCLAGVDTLRSLEAVLQECTLDDCDLTVVTGDVASGGDEVCYRRFLGLQERYLRAPFAWLPGNHDEPERMAQFKPLDRVVEANNWTILLLDSKQQGAVAGLLGEAQLSWLAAQLRQLESEHILICLHHHVLDVGSTWIDQLKLEDAPQLWQLLAQEDTLGRVKAILSGHVHQATDLVFQGCRVLTSPSTCIQFAANSEDFALDDNFPGYRRLRLHVDGRIETSIIRIQDRRFSADLSCAGY